MFSKFIHLHEKRLELEAKLSDPAVMAKQNEYRRLSKEHAHVIKMDELYIEFQKTTQQVIENQELLTIETDDEMLAMIKGDVAELLDRQASLEQQLKILLLPADPNDQKNILLEIRAGTGGDEAALFAADLFRMYSRYAETQGWKIEILSSNAIGIGGFKEVIALVKGDKVFSRLKYESGVHRVQRVPETEAQGRIHTSAVTVAVMPEAEEVELQLQPNELRIDIFRSSGPGGQSVNTTDSAVRITHVPSGMIVICQDEKSQHKNKEAAMKVMRARLLDKLQQAQHDEISATRKSQIGSGDRSERIRTYNFPQGRVSDHRINLTLYKIEEIMLGKLDDLLDPLLSHFQAEALKTIQ
jgi:peptide chain release factor 1